MAGKNWQGTTFGNYRADSLLGKGSFGEVYLGVHIHLDTQVAIKLLHGNFDKKEIEKFRAEAKRLRQLENPHIIKVQDFGIIEQDTPYLVLDYAPNGSLREHFVSGTPVQPETILPSVRQIAGALHYAHDRGVIHRDVKPANILLSATKEALLSDFGLAIGLQSLQQQTGNGLRGTPAYAAPEQFTGQAFPTSDQYALASCIYEWLTGKLPFDNPRGDLIGAQKALYPPRPLRDLAPTVPPAVEEVVLTALAKDPAQRFASMRAFATAFEHACQAQDRPARSQPDQPRVTNLLLLPPDLVPGASASDTALAPAPVTGARLPSNPIIAPAPPPDPLAPPRRQRRRVPLLAALLVVALLVGALSVGLPALYKQPSRIETGTATARVSPTSTTQVSPTSTVNVTIPPDFKLYTSPDHSFRLFYPPGWTMQAPNVGGAGAEFDGPHDQKFTATNRGTTGQGPKQNIELFCTGFLSFTNNTFTTVTINGQQWMREECESVVGGQKAIAEAISYNSNTFFMAYTSDTDTFTKDIKTYFSIMESSFTFLTPP